MCPLDTFLKLNIIQMVRMHDRIHCNKARSLPVSVGFVLLIKVIIIIKFYKKAVFTQQFYLLLGQFKVLFICYISEVSIDRIRSNCRSITLLVFIIIGSYRIRAHLAHFDFVRTGRIHQRRDLLCGVGRTFFRDLGRNLNGLLRGRFGRFLCRRFGGLLRRRLGRCLGGRLGRCLGRCLCRCFRGLLRRLRTGLCRFCRVLRHLRRIVFPVEAEQYSPNHAAGQQAYTGRYADPFQDPVSLLRLLRCLGPAGLPDQLLISSFYKTMFLHNTASLLKQVAACF